jgi:broad specificity phosphatase PhoE
MSDPALMRPLRVVLVRHGATEWSAAGRHTGRTDPELNEFGRDQAERAARVVVDVLDGADPLVFSSPLRRARSTAEVMMPGARVEELDALAEVDYGLFEGLTSTDIEQRQPGWSVFRNGCPDGESVFQITARCDSFVAKLERMAAGRVVIAFTHGHLGRALTTRLLDLPITAADSLQSDTASVAAIDLKRGRYVLSSWNRRS